MAAGTLYLAVIGPADAKEQQLEDAYVVGRCAAEAGAVVVTGGMGGVMEAACSGAVAAGGLTVGLLPGSDRSDGNAHLTIALPTGIGELRNGLVVRASDAVVAVGGSWGTLSEIALALRTGRTVVGVGAWSLPAPHSNFIEAASPADAVRAAVEHAERRLR